MHTTNTSGNICQLSWEWLFSQRDNVSLEDTRPLPLHNLFISWRLTFENTCHPPYVLPTTFKFMLLRSNPTSLYPSRRKLSYFFKFTIHVNVPFCIRTFNIDNFLFVHSLSYDLGHKTLFLHPSDIDFTDDSTSQVFIILSKPFILKGNQFFFSKQTSVISKATFLCTHFKLGPQDVSWSKHLGTKCHFCLPFMPLCT